MKKIIIVIILLTVCVTAKAQYFIPVFDENLSRTLNCTQLTADTVHNLLYVSSVYRTGIGTIVDTSRLYAYRNNKLTQVGPTLNFTHYYKGAMLSSGRCVILSGFNYDYDFHTSDSLNLTDCYGNVCYENGDINCIISINDTIYVGGFLGKFQNLNSYNIGGIDTSGNEFPLASGMTDGTGSVFALEYFNGELYAGGGFNEMNHAPANNIARWDGSAWHPLEQGLSWYAGVMKEYNGKLYVGGGFDSAGGMFCNGIARWTGVTWETLKEFKKVNLDFSDMEVYHNKLYMLGNFDDYDSGTNSFTYVSGFFQYDGITLKHFNVGDRLVSRGSSLEVFNDTLFISGKFDSLSYVPAKRLVKFVDGTFSTYAPVTTKWWYNSSAEGQQQPNSCYKYYEVTRDTFVMNTPPTSGYNCRKIKAEQYLPNKIHTALQPLYVFGDTNRIMYYNNYQKRFVEGYRFNVKVGDTITYYAPEPQFPEEETFRVVVDSVTTLIVQTEKLKRVYTTPLDGWSFGNDGYAQLIGGLASMLPQPINYYSNEGPLSCYQDTSLYFKYFTGGVSCDYAVSVVTEKKETSFTIYPNPATNQLEVSGLEFEVGDEVAVTNLLGQEMERKVIANPISNLKFQITSYPSGIYFVQIKTKNGTASAKFVKK